MSVIGSSLAARVYTTAGTNAEGAPGVAERVDLDGSQIVKLLSAKNLGYAEEGTLYTAQTPTVGTPVALGIAAATAIVATAPSMLLVNTDSKKSIILESIKLLVGGAGTGNTTLKIGMFVDLLNRYTSGGTAATPVGANSDIATMSIAKFYDASVAIVATAAGSLIRKVDSLMVRTAIPVVGDTYLLDFGTNAGISNGVTNGTAALGLTFPVAPVVVGPGHSFLLYIFAASMSAAPTFEYVVSWIER